MHITITPGYVGREEEPQRVLERWYAAEDEIRVAHSRRKRRHNRRHNRRHDKSTKKEIEQAKPFCCANVA